MMAVAVVEQGHMRLTEWSSRPRAGTRATGGRWTCRGVDRVNFNDPVFLKSFLCSSSRAAALAAVYRQGGRRSARLQRRSGAPTAVAARKSRMLVRCQGAKVTVTLRLDHKVRYGEQHAFLGSSESAGVWQKRVPMEWTEAGWVADLNALPGEEIEFKYLIVTADGNVIWERGHNRVLVVPSNAGRRFQVVSHWDATEEEVRFEALSGAAPQADDAQAAGGVKPAEPKHLPATPQKDLELETESAFMQGWQGKDISFMRSNQHSHQREGRWDTTGLDDPAKHIVEGDKSSANWWRKLEVVHTLLTGNLGKSDRLEALTDSAIYLKWIKTGQIQCREDGGHYRPNKHAEISRLIFRELERLTLDEAVTPIEALVLRNIHPCLPSFRAEFTASVPLTRIRDIAHRNDIPHDLKTEIKHTIQNKLHRNAGPEDLVATEVLLARVTRTPGEYSQDFVEQLKLFYVELKEFFNAESLTELLNGLRGSIKEQITASLANFVESKQSLDKALGSDTGSSAKSADLVVGALRKVTGLRTLLVQELKTGLNTDASDDAIAMRQKCRISEIGLEDYSFVLLSRYVNFLDESGGANVLIEEAKSGNVFVFNQPLEAVILSIRQIRLVGWQEEECTAIENELDVWQADGIVQNHGFEEDIKVWARRIKATLDRTRRLSETYTDTLVQLYPKRAERLGSAFGIPENSVKTYTEAAIRASVVFQLSKLLSVLLKATRAVSGSDGWDVLMPGQAVGRLLEVERIEPRSIPSSNEPVILLVKKADGDEEVKGAERIIAGVILQHELPHLSHLGVRVRQEKVPFVTLDAEDKLVRLGSFLGQVIRLNISSEGVSIISTCDKYDWIQEEKKKINTTFQPESTNVSSIMSITQNQVQSYKVKRGNPGTVLQIQDATPDTSGAKAAACCRLAALAYLPETSVTARFQVPRSRVIPFGAMEDALERAGLKNRYRCLIDTLQVAHIAGGSAGGDDLLDDACAELRSLVSSVRPLAAVTTSIDSEWEADPDTRVIIRSSANVEDVAGVSAAGLYESIPNVSVRDIEAVGAAVAQVWASLYTRRAVQSRRAGGITDANAAMAVLVQQLLVPELSFVLHTVGPTDGNPNVVHMEIASGLGETLAAGTRGSPWRLVVDKLTRHVTTLAFANFSHRMCPAKTATMGGITRQTVNYSTEALSKDTAFRITLGQRLAAVGVLLDQHFGCPQDVEGCLMGDHIFIVQTRPQP